MQACFRRAAGFSLVELLVVLSIMLLITAIAMPRFLDAQMKAYEASAVSFLKTLQSNQESYRLAHGTYADNFTDLGMVALGPAVPGDFFSPEAAPRLANLFAQLGPFTVYAAQATQQPPPQNPPPPKDDQPGVSGKSNRNTRKSGGALGGIGGGSGGSGGGTRPGGGSGGVGGATGPGGRRPRRGAGGAGAGSTPTGGGSGTGAPAGSGAPQTGGGSGGGLSPTPPPAATTNVVLKHNYIFTLTRPTPTTWACTVAPVRNRGNARFLFLDQTGVMRAEVGKFAAATSPQI